MCVVRKSGGPETLLRSGAAASLGGYAPRQIQKVARPRRISLQRQWRAERAGKAGRKWNGSTRTRSNYGQGFVLSWVPTLSYAGLLSGGGHARNVQPLWSAGDVRYGNRNLGFWRRDLPHCQKPFRTRALFHHDAGGLSSGPSENVRRIGCFELRSLRGPSFENFRKIRSQFFGPEACFLRDRWHQIRINFSRAGFPTRNRNARHTQLFGESCLGVAVPLTIGF